MRYVALLRGINVGGKSKVEMAKLKKVFESLEFTNVLTYINSGNVLFETKKQSPSILISIIEKKLEAAFGFPIRTMVCTAEGLQKVAETIPSTWKNDSVQRTDVLFLWEKFDSKKTINLIVKREGVDVLRYVPGAIIWNLKRVNYNKSAMRKFIGTEVYKHMTARNVNTVRKLAKLAEEG